MTNIEIREKTNEGSIAITRKVCDLEESVDTKELVISRTTYTKDNKTIQRKTIESSLSPTMPATITIQKRNEKTVLDAFLADWEFQFGSGFVVGSGAGETAFRISVTELDSTHFVICYVGYVNKNSYARAVVGVVNGLNITFGTPVYINSAYVSFINCAKIDDAHIVVTYSHNSLNAVKIGTIVGDAISFGSEYSLVDGDVSLNNIAVLDDTHFVVVYRRTVDADGCAVVGTIDGAYGVTFGDVYDFSPGYDIDYYGTIDIGILDSSHIVISCVPTSYEVGCVVGTINGTVIAFGSMYLATANYPKGPFLTVLDSAHFVFAVQKTGSSSYYGIARVGVVVGNTISYGPETVFYTGYAYDISLTTYDTSKILIVWRDSTMGKVTRAKVIGNTLIFGNVYVFSESITDYNDCCSLSKEYAVVSFRIGTTLTTKIIRINEL